MLGVFGHPDAMMLVQIWANTNQHVTTGWPNACNILCPQQMIPVSPPWRVHPHSNLSISTSPPLFDVFSQPVILKHNGPKEWRIISTCDSIWLRANLIKLNQYGGELGAGEPAMGRNWQLPPSTILWTCRTEMLQSFGQCFIFQFWNLMQFWYWIFNIKASMKNQAYSTIAAGVPDYSS